MNRYWLYAIFSIGFFLFLAIIFQVTNNNRDRGWFNRLDENEDGMVSLMEWELQYQQIFLSAAGLTLFGRLDCDDSQYLTWREYQEGRLNGDQCLSESSILSQSRRNTAKKLPYPIVILTEEQNEIVLAQVSYLEQYGHVLGRLPDVRDNVTDNHEIRSIDCGEQTIRSTELFYSQLLPGDYPSIECVITSDSTGYYTWAGIKIMGDNIELPVNFIKPLYVSRRKMKIYIYSESSLSNSSVVIF